MQYQTRCDHGGRPCPRIFQAIPVEEEAPRRRPAVATIIVVGLLAAVTILEGIVPRIAEMIR